MRWWQFGLVGGMVLSIATGIKAVRALKSGGLGEHSFRDAVLFAATIFAMGFICGLVVCVGRGWHRRIGAAGDALLGMIVMIVFFLSCMVVFSPEMFGPKLKSQGLPMLGIASIIGLIGGVWTGRDLRN